MSYIPDEFCKWKVKDYKKELYRILIMNGYQEVEGNQYKVLTKSGKSVKKTFTLGFRSFLLETEEDGRSSSICHPYDYDHCVLNAMIISCK